MTALNEIRQVVADRGYTATYPDGGLFTRTGNHSPWDSGENISVEAGESSGRWQVFLWLPQYDDDDAVNGKDLRGRRIRAIVAACLKAGYDAASSTDLPDGAMAGATYRRPADDDKIEVIVFKDAVRIMSVS